MSIEQVLTALKFTTTQWVEVARCALRDNHSVGGSSLDLDQLEARVLYSATPLPVAEIADSEQAAPAPEPSDNDAGAGQLAGATAVSDEIRTSEDSLALLDQIPSELAAAEAEQQSRYELVFVDQSTTGYEQFIDNLTSNLGEGRRLEVIVLDSSSNGLQQITQTLAERQNVDAIHVVSNGEMQQTPALGNLWLSTENLGSYADELSAWSHSLSDDAQLLFYDCHLAEGQAGRALLAAFQELTGAASGGQRDHCWSRESGARRRIRRQPIHVSERTADH